MNSSTNTRPTVYGKWASWNPDGPWPEPEKVRAAGYGGVILPLNSHSLVPSAFDYVQRVREAELDVVGLYTGSRQDVLAGQQRAKDLANRAGAVLFETLELPEMTPLILRLAPSLMGPDYLGFATAWHAVFQCAQYGDVLPGAAGTQNYLGILHNSALSQVNWLLNIRGPEQGQWPAWIHLWQDSAAPCQLPHWKGDASQPDVTVHTSWQLQPFSTERRHAVTALPSPWPSALEASTPAVEARVWSQRVADYGPAPAVEARVWSQRLVAHYGPDSPLAVHVLDDTGLRPGEAVTDYRDANVVCHADGSVDLSRTAHQWLVRTYEQVHLLAHDLDAVEAETEQQYATLSGKVDTLSTAVGTLVDLVTNALAERANEAPFPPAAAPAPQPEQGQRDQQPFRDHGLMQFAGPPVGVFCPPESYPTLYPPFPPLPSRVPGSFAPSLPSLISPAEKVRQVVREVSSEYPSAQEVAREEFEQIDDSPNPNEQELNPSE